MPVDGYRRQRWRDGEPNDHQGWLRPRDFRARRFVGALGLIVLVLGLSALVPDPSHGARRSKPYDAKIMRLSEILGAVHYLRELCGSGDGPMWREQMRAIIKSEGSTALRRARLTGSFNKGYRSYSRTYNECTPSAKTAIERFIVEGVGIADGLIKNNR